MLADRWPTLVSLILACLVALTPEVVRAQQIEDTRVAVGTPLQVSTASATYRGAMLLSQTSSELVVQESCGSGCARMVTIPWSEVTRVDAAIRHHSVRRAALGGAVGVAYSLALGYGASKFLPCHRDGGSCSGFGAVLFVPLIVSVGGGLGVASGWQSTYEKWQQVWPD